MKPRPGDIVEVLWRDSERVTVGWQSPRKYLRVAGHPTGYRTAGYWVGERGGSVVIALSVDPFNGTIADAMCIPKVAVTSIQVLGRAHKRVRRALAP